MLWRPLVGWFTGAWAIFSILASVRDNFLPDTVRDKLQVLKIIPTLPWWGWVLGVLVILLLTAMEGAYQEIRRRDAVIEQNAPKPPAFRDRGQLHATEQYHDINLTLVNTALTDWFTVSVLDVRPRVPRDDARPPWLVKWADTDDERRHLPKNSTAVLRLCRIESHESDKNRKAMTARFFRPKDEFTTLLSLADAWNAQGILIGFQMVNPEIDLRITATDTKQTTDRRVALVLNDSLEPRVWKVEVLR